MRMSCNGCRILRKGCNENCSIRPCLQWIKSPDSQANATLFLAKFYGRAGLMNLIHAGPEHLRPEIFRSLLYEACGRIVNPIYGSVGLLWSGNWQLCQVAVQAVLKGEPIVQIPSEAAANSPIPLPPLKAHDIRHVYKCEKSSSATSHDRHKVKTRNRFKRSSAKPKPKAELATDLLPREPVIADSVHACNRRWRRCYTDDHGGAAVQSRDSSVSPQSERDGEGDSRESDSTFSVVMYDTSLASRNGLEPVSNTSSDSELELELKLGFETVSRTHNVRPTKGRCSEIYGSNDNTCKMELSLDYPA